jgi:tetratricopeptide (TPR) repeat protein
MALRTFFGCRIKGGERVLLFLVLPVVAVVTAGVIYFLVHEAKEVPREAESAISGPVRPTEVRPRLEPQVLLQKLKEAEGLEKLGDFAAAEPAFAAITETNPESDRAWGGLGRTLVAGKKYQEASAALDQACRLNLVEPRHFAARGAARRAMNDLKHAIRDYRDALSLDPKNIENSNILLFVALEIGTADLFERTLAKVRQDNPGAEARWVMAVAVSEMRAGNSDAAVEILNKAPEILSPDQYRTLLSDRIFTDKRSQDVIAKLGKTVSP